MEETVGSSSSVLGYIASVDVKGSCDHHDTDRSLLAARASPDTPGPSSAWWCCPASLRGAPSQTASEGSPQRPRTPPSPRPLQSGGAQERSRQDLSGHCRHSPGRLSRRVLPLLPPGAGLCASLSWTVWSRWGDTSTPRACVSSRRPRTASRSALLQTTVRWTVMICLSQLAKKADRIKLIITLPCTRTDGSRSPPRQTAGPWWLCCTLPSPRPPVWRTASHSWPPHKWKWHQNCFDKELMKLQRMFWHYLSFSLIVSLDCSTNRRTRERRRNRKV